MKTSKKILLVVASLVIVLLIIFVVIMRNTVQSLHAKAELKIKYKTMSVENFKNLDISSYLIVRIKRGKECKVEYTCEADSILKPELENIYGTLHIKVDSAFKKENTGNIQVRITMPAIQDIKAAPGTEIQLENFQSDSLHVMLENGCAFKGKNNKFKHVSFNTSGNSCLELTSTL